MGKIVGNQSSIKKVLKILCLFVVSSGFTVTTGAEEVTDFYSLKGAKAPGFEFLDMNYHDVKTNSGLEGLRSLYADVTRVHYSNQHGVQYEYTDEDGTAHQWMAGGAEILKGQWKLKTDPKGALICFAYTGSVIDVDEDDFDCGAVEAHQSGATDRIKGDFFELKTMDKAVALPKGTRLGHSQMTLKQELTSLPIFSNRHILREELRGKLEWYKGTMGGVDLEGVDDSGQPFNVLFYAGEALCTLERGDDCGYKACKPDRKVKKEFKAYKKQMEGQTLVLRKLLGMSMPGGRIALEADVTLEDGRKLTEAYVEDGWGFRPGDTMPDRFWKKSGCGSPVQAPTDQ